MDARTTYVQKYQYHRANNRAMTPRHPHLAIKPKIMKATRDGPRMRPAPTAIFVKYLPNYASTRELHRIGSSKGDTVPPRFRCRSNQVDGRSEQDRARRKIIFALDVSSGKDVLRGPAEYHVTQTQSNSPENCLWN